MSEPKRPRLDDDLWGDELDANTVEECFFLASQAMSQSAPAEAGTTKEEAQPSTTSSESPGEKFKVPQSVAHFKPKQPSSHSSSSLSSTFKKKYPSSTQLQTFPKKVPASASQSQTFPQKRQHSPTQLDVHRKSLSSHIGPKMVSASKSVPKAPPSTTAFSTSKLPATIHSVSPSDSVGPTWPHSKASFSKPTGAASTFPLNVNVSSSKPAGSVRPSDTSSRSFSTSAGQTSYMKVMGSSSSGSSMEIGAMKPVRPMQAMPADTGSRVTRPVKPEGNVPFSTPVLPTESKELEKTLESGSRMVRSRETEPLRYTSMFPTASTSEVPADNEDMFNELQQLRTVKKKLEDELLSKDGEVAILRIQLNSVKSDLEKQRALKEQEVEKQASEFRGKMKELQKLLDQKSTLLEFKTLEAGNAEERCRLLESQNKVKLVEPQPATKTTVGKFPENPIPSTSVKEKKQDITTGNEGNNTVPETKKDGTVGNKKPTEEQIEEWKKLLKVEPNTYKPLSHGWRFGTCISPYIFERPMYGIERKPERLYKKEPGLNLTPYGITVDVLHPVLTKLMLREEFEKDSQSIIMIDKLIWKCYQLLTEQMAIMQKEMVPIDDRKADYLDSHLLQETGKIYKDEKVNIMSARRWFKNEQSIEIRRIFGVLSSLAISSDFAAKYMAGNIRQKFWLNTMYIKNLRLPPELIESREQYMKELHKNRPKPKPQKKKKKTELIDKELDIKRRFEERKVWAKLKKYMHEMAKLNEALKFLVKYKQAFINVLKGKPLGLDPEAEEDLTKEADYWIDYYGRKAILDDQIEKSKEATRKAEEAENVDEPEIVQKPKPKTMEYRYKKEKYVPSEQELDDELRALGLEREDWINVDPFKKPEKPLSPNSYLRNYVIKCRKMGRFSNIKPLDSLKPKSSQLVKKHSNRLVVEPDSESHYAVNESAAGSSKQAEASTFKPLEQPPPSPSSPHSEDEVKKEEKIYHMHPMKWNMISVEEARRRITGKPLELKKAIFSPLKEELDKKLKYLLPSPLEKIQLRKELAEKKKPEIKMKPIFIHPLWVPQIVPGLFQHKLNTLTPEEIKKLTKRGEPHWQGPPVDFFQFLCDMVQIIADQRWTVTCNGILFGVTTLIKDIVLHTKIKEERCEVLTKLIKELLLCRPSIDVLTELLVVLYRVGHIKTIQENLCIGKGPDPYLRGRFSLVHFYKGQPRMDMGPEPQKIYYYYRTKSCMISLITFMVTLLRADDMEWYYKMGMAMLLWMSTSSCIPPHGATWIGPFINKEMRDCQCRARIIEALIIMMHVVYEYMEKYKFKPRHSEDYLFLNLKDFLGTAVRFIKKLAYLDNDTGLLMTNREGEYQIVIRGLWAHVDTIDFGIDERKALKILNQLEDRVDVNVPKTKYSADADRIMGEISDKIMSFFENQFPVAPREEK